MTTEIGEHTFKTRRAYAKLHGLGFTRHESNVMVTAWKARGQALGQRTERVQAVQNLISAWGQPGDAAGIEGLIDKCFSQRFIDVTVADPGHVVLTDDDTHCSFTLAKLLIREAERSGCSFAEFEDPTATLSEMLEKALNHLFQKTKTGDTA